MMDSFTCRWHQVRVRVALQRQVKPYWVQLDDVRRDERERFATRRRFLVVLRIVDNENRRGSQGSRLG